MILLTTERLIIRQVETTDRPALMRVFGDAQVMRFGDGVQTPVWVDAWLCSCLKSYDLRGFGPYVVLEQNSGELVGYCGLFHFPDVNGRAEVELGYRLARSAWGRGYATEAAAAVRDYAFQALNIPRLIAIIDPSNEASIRVAKKIGMQYEADLMLDGYTHPDYVYAIAKE